MMSHEDFMHRCFQLARKAGSKVKSNPNVGAVLVFNNTIIGEGYHEFHGGPHAEVNAVNSVREEDRHLINKSKLYVSLEPCCFTGKTGPCTSLILNNKIPEVYISTLDPNIKVAGKGVKILEDNGVKVHTGILEHLGQILIRPFVANLSNKPYVTLKWAKSKDNFMGCREKQLPISNALSNVFVHKLRAENDGILIGANTAVIDNPKLTTREYPGKSPIRIVLDSSFRTPNTHHLQADEHPALFYNESVENSKGNKRYIKSSMNMSEILEDLYSRGICRLLVEGGQAILKSFINQKIWDEAIVISSNKAIEEGVKAPNLIGQVHRKYDIMDDTIHCIYPNTVKMS